MQTALAAVVDVAVPVAVAAMMAEWAAGRGDCRPRYAADHGADWAADRSAGGDASEGTDRLCRRRAGAERKASQRDQGNLVHDRFLPQF